MPHIVSTASGMMVLAVEAIRSVNGAPKVESEIHYFLSSCRDDPAILGQAIRSHWAIENESMQTCGVCSGPDRFLAHEMRVSRWRNWCGG